MFGRKRQEPEPQRQEPEPQGRYFTELIVGKSEVEFHRPGQRRVSYEEEQREYQKGVQAALDRGNERGWTLISATSPASSVTSAEGVIGCMSPTLLFWDTESS